MGKKVTLDDAINTSVWDVEKYKKILRKLKTKDLQKALDILEQMENTKTKRRYISQEIRLREPKEKKDDSTTITVELREEWDRVRLWIRRLAGKNDGI